MKRIVTLILAMAMVLSLAACGGSSTQESKPAESAKPEQSAPAA